MKTRKAPITSKPRTRKPTGTDRKKPARNAAEMTDDLPVIHLDATQRDADWIKYVSKDHPLRRPGESDEEFMRRDPIKQYLAGTLPEEDRRLMRLRSKTHNNNR